MTIIITEALERFLVQLKADGRSEHTIGQYRRHVRTLAQWARTVRPRCDRLQDLDHEAVARFLADPCATSRARAGGEKLPTSLNTLRSSLRSFLSYCHRAGYIRLDPGRLIRRALCSPPPPNALSAEEEDRLLGTLEKAEEPEDVRDHAMFHLMLRSGLRLGSRLRVEDVDLERGELRIQAKGNRRDRVFLGEDVKVHLGGYVGERTSGPLFYGQGGNALTPRHVARRLRKWIRAAGIKRAVSPHSLRHRFAMRIYSKTGDILLVKEALCHRSIASTLIYAQADEKRLREAL